jgi:hypothetical protein
MKLRWGLRRWGAGSPTVIAIACALGIASLSGCWEVAVPLTGLVAFSAGTTVAEANSVPKARPSPSLAHQSDGRIPQAVARSAKPLVTVDLPVPAAQATFPPTSIVMVGADSPRQEINSPERGTAHHGMNVSPK